MSTVAGTRRRRRAIALSVAGVVTLVTAAVAWLGATAWQARAELDAAAPLAQELITALGDGDVSGAQVTLTRLQSHADRARDLTASAGWATAEVVPWVGAQLSAVRTVAAGLASVAADGLPPLIGVAGELAGNRDTEAIAAAREPLRGAADTFGAARRAVDGIDTGLLIEPVADGVGQARAALGTGASVVDALSRASVVVPGLLGRDGTRDVLVLLQNTAEARTGGGITGAFVQLRIDEGDVSLVSQADSTQFAPRTDAIVAVPGETTAVYGDVVGRFVQNATMTSDFALSARLASAWWQEATGAAVDAVVAIDPFVLRALLAEAGPVTLADGSILSADNVVQRLLVDPYRTLDGDAQTAYLQEVAAAVFAALVDRVDPISWARALAPVVADGRISVWSAVPSEQQAIAGTAIGGMLARVDAAGADAYGVYFNDATGGKMDGFLGVAVDSGVASCGANRSPEAVVRVTLGNDAPAEATSWPLSVTGGGMWGTAIGDIGTLVSVAAPAGAVFGGVFAEDGSALSSSNAVDAGRPTTAVRVNVSPGQRETVEFRFVVPADSGSPVVVHTPMMNEIPLAAASGLACRE